MCKALFTLSLLAVLAGCVTPPATQPSSQLKLADSLSVSRTLAHTTRVAWPDDAWWKSYADPQLDSLVTEALANSPSLRAAAARIRQAEANAHRTGAVMQPSFSLHAEATPQRFSEHYIFPPPYAGSYETPALLTASLNWELDFWGQHRAALDAALSTTEAARADAQAARLTLASAVVRAYIEFDRLVRQALSAKAEIARRQQVLHLLQLRVNAKLASQIELRSTEAGISAAQAESSSLDDALLLARNRLVALAGQGPDRGLALTTPTLSFSGTPGLPSVVPADLLGRRPDLTASRLRIEASQDETRAARAAFYPNINLSGFVGLQSIGLDKLLQSGSSVVGIGPALSLPIFDSVRLKSAYQSRQAELDIAIETYNGALIEALHEVADPLDSWHGAMLREQSLQAAADAEQAQLNLMQQREQHGLGSHIEVLDAAGRVLAAQRHLIDNRSQQLNASASLAQALGGGYQPAVRQ